MVWRPTLGGARRQRRLVLEQKFLVELQAGNRGRERVLDPAGEHEFPREP